MKSARHVGSSNHVARFMRTGRCPSLMGLSTTPSLREFHAPSEVRPCPRILPQLPVSRGSRTQQHFASSSGVVIQGPNRTNLYEIHIEHGGQMVEFGGYSMAVKYSDLSVSESHEWTRTKVSLFDVGHMVQHHLSGPGSAALLEKMTPSSTADLKPYNSTLSCLLHPNTGGIVDDCVITRLGPELFYVVTNAACKSKDCEYIAEQIAAQGSADGSIDWTVKEGWGLIALQGPLSADVLESALDSAGAEGLDLKSLYFGECKSINIRLPSMASRDPIANIMVSRGGYTGEDGFEISIPPSLTLDFTRHLLKAGGEDRLRLAGLGARDSLRLEAGMCLYGHDLNDAITPVEGGLSWVVHKNRRTHGGFHGDRKILEQLKPAKEGGGVERRRIGLIVHGAPAREGAEIVGSVAEGEDEVIGKVTSGCPSPTLGKNIAMGYVKQGMHKPGTQLGIMVRGKRRPAEVVKMPFVRSRYWKQAAGTAPA